MTLPDLLNVPAGFEHGGVTYHPKQLDLEGLAKFSRWLEARAVAAVERVDCEEPARQQWRALVVQEVAAGVYEPHGAGFYRAAATPEGQVKLLALALADEHPELTEGQVREMFLAKYEAAVRVALEALGDPKVFAAYSARGDPSSPGSGTAIPSGGKAGRSKKSGGSRRRKSR